MKHSNEKVALTNRESECLSLSARGLSSKQIAEQLGISIGAVDTHCGNAARKLAAKTRIHAVARAIEFGLIKP